MAARTHRELVAWQRAMDLAVEIYRATKQFPRELYGLTSQVRRAAVSVPSNIAEGQGRGIGADSRTTCGLDKDRCRRRRHRSSWPSGLAVLRLSMSNP